jgi:hypothetical protein
MKFNHVGIPTVNSFEGEIPLPHLKVTVSDHLNNPFGIQWRRCWQEAPYPDLVKTVPHVAFDVVVGFIEVNGAPVELMQIDYEDRPDL